MTPVVENGIVLAHMGLKQNMQTGSDIIDVITKGVLSIETMPFFTTG